MDFLSQPRKPFSPRSFIENGPSSGRPSRDYISHWVARRHSRLRRRAHFNLDRHSRRPSRHPLRRNDNIFDSDSDVSVASSSTTVKKDEKTNTDNFHQFAKFPPEVQIIVWKFACYVPRTVPVWASSRSILEPAITRGRNYNFAYRFETDSPTPAVMRACQESRYAALKVYKRMFHVKKELPLATMYSPPRIWINAETNLVCPTRKGEIWHMRFRTEQFNDFCAVIKQNKIANLAIDDQSSSDLQKDGSDEWRNFEVVPKWMGPHIKNIVQYTTLHDRGHPVNMLYPLNLVNYTDETRNQRLSDYQDHTRQQRIDELGEMLDYLDECQEFQQSVNRVTSKEGRIPDVEGLEEVPGWLRDAVDTYTRPATYSMVALQ